MSFSLGEYAYEMDISNRAGTDIHTVKNKRYRGNKHMITFSDLNQLNQIYENENHDGRKYILRGLTRVGWRTIKGFNNELSEEELQNYYADRVRDPNFLAGEFYQIQFFNPIIQ